MLAVRPYCSNEQYWQVYFDTNRVIRETLEEAGFHAAEQPIVVRTGNGTVATSPTIAAATRSL
jgi:small conductance mechanosensitive channel